MLFGASKAVSSKTPIAKALSRSQVLEFPYLWRECGTRLASSLFFIGVKFPGPALAGNCAEKPASLKEGAVRISTDKVGTSQKISETGRIRFREVRFQAPKLSKFFGLTEEFRERTQ